MKSQIYLAIVRVIAIAPFGLFVGAPDVRDRMFVRTLNELKAKFTFVILPAMPVKFVQKILSGREQEAEVIEKNQEDGNKTRTGI